MEFRAKLEKLAGIGQQRVEFSLQSVLGKSLSCDGWNRKRTHMLIDEEDGDVVTLCVLRECSLDSVNFGLWENEHVPRLYFSEEIVIAY
jgi:hypothetical protein